MEMEQGMSVMLVGREFSFWAYYVWLFHPTLQWTKTVFWSHNSADNWWSMCKNVNRPPSGKLLAHTPFAHGQCSIRDTGFRTPANSSIVGHCFGHRGYKIHTVTLPYCLIAQLSYTWCKACARVRRFSLTLSFLRWSTSLWQLTS